MHFIKNKLLKLGIIYKDNKVINHRSLMKVLVNPILAPFGYCISSLFDDKDIFVEYRLVECEKESFIKRFCRAFFYKADYDKILKEKEIV